MNTPPTSLPLISIIILNWNGQQYLRSCLESLDNQTFDKFETIVVDNGSTDSSVDIVRQEFPHVVLIELNQNTGFCRGNNLGVAQALGDYIFFLNNDTEVHPLMLLELSRAIESSPPSVGMWAVKMLRWSHRDTIDNLGCGYSALGTGYMLKSGEPYNTQLPQERQIFGSSGGAGCYRRQVLDEIGLFDESFFFNNEDVDLAFRAQLAGFTCQLVPAAIVYHHGSSTGGATSNMTVYHIQRNKEWVFFKNMPTPLLWLYLWPHLIYSIAWGLYWATKGKGKVVLQAKIDALWQWRVVYQKRKNIQSTRRISWIHLNRLIDKRRAIFFWNSQTFKSIIKRLYHN